MSSEDTNPFPKRLPEFSRALDDSEDSDWDEADSAVQPRKEHPSPGNYGNCVLRLGAEARAELSSRETGRLDCSTLLVGVGPAACGFLAACVLAQEAKIIGFLSCGFPEAGLLANTLGQTELGDFACFLYRLECNPQVIVCQVMSPVPAADCHAFMASLLSLLDPESLDVAVLCTQPLSGYQSALPVSALPSPLLRCLRTSSMVVGKAAIKGRPTASAPSVAELEPPNLLTGLPAELLSVCQMRRIPAVAYAAYLPADSGGDTEAMAAFRPALGGEPLRHCRPSWPKDADRVMQQLAGLSSASRIGAGISSAFSAPAALYI